MSRIEKWQAGLRWTNRRKRALGLVLAAPLILIVLTACQLISQIVPTPSPTETPGAPASTQAAPTLPSALKTATPTAAPSAGQPTPPGPITNLNQGLVFGAQINADEFGGDTCSFAQQLGVKANTIWLSWQEVEPKKGTFRWDLIDGRVQSNINCAITDLGIHFEFRSSWATQPAPTGKKGQTTISMPPKNLDDAYNVLFQLASHLKGKVHRYAIENEAEGQIHWAAPPETYFAVLPTAYKAIKAADPTAIVEDSGTGSSAYGVAIASQMVQAGQGNAAIPFVNDYYSRKYVAGKPPNVTNAATLQTFLNDPQVENLTRYQTWFPLLYANSANYDVSQIHFYAPWDQFTAVTNFVKSQLNAHGAERPIEVWELGYGWTDRSTYNPTAHAQDTVKLLSSAAGAGASRVIYWKLIDDATKKGQGKVASTDVGLIQNDQLSPAAVAYRLTVQKLAGSTSAQRIDLGNPAVWAYRFTKNGNATDVIWSIAPATVSVSMGAPKVLVTDITGKTLTADANAIAVGVSPIFVQAAP